MTTLSFEMSPPLQPCLNIPLLSHYSSVPCRSLTSAATIEPGRPVASEPLAIYPHQAKKPTTELFSNRETIVACPSGWVPYLTLDDRSYSYSKVHDAKPRHL